MDGEELEEGLEEGLEEELGWELFQNDDFEEAEYDEEKDLIDDDHRDRARDLNSISRSYY